jgi:hypothetical protein
MRNIIFRQLHLTVVVRNIIFRQLLRHWLCKSTSSGNFSVTEVLQNIFTKLLRHRCSAEHLHETSPSLVFCRTSSGNFSVTGVVQTNIFTKLLRHWCSAEHLHETSPVTGVVQTNILRQLLTLVLCGPQYRMTFAHDIDCLYISTSYLISHPNTKKKKKKNSVALARKRTMPTGRPPLVGEVRANFCG